MGRVARDDSPQRWRTGSDKAQERLVVEIDRRQYWIDANRLMCGRKAHAHRYGGRQHA